MDTPIGDMPLEEYVAEMVALWYDTPPCPLVAVRARKDLVARIVVLVQAEVNAAIAIERERCARVCDDISVDRWQQYKGQGRHAPNNPHRADPFMDGQSQGADACAAAVRALSHTSTHE
jgi:hypothetical protein